MQIHEITKINEAVYSGPSVNAQPGAKTSPIAGALKKAGSAYQSVKGGVQGAVQGYQQSQNNRQVAQATKDVAGKASKVWLQYAQQLKAATPDPTRYAALYKQALTAFVQKNLLKGQNIGSAINRQEINQLIDSITAAEANPAQVTQLMSKLAQQTSISQPDTSVTSLVKIVSANPTVIQYRNIEYAQNNDGNWANQKTGKVPDESFQAFMDQEVRKAGA